MNTQLSSFVSVRAHSSRSIHLEQDSQQTTVVENYILTSQARTVLQRLMDQIQEPFPVRAWTLTGPYGAGKSYFGLFLTNLLCPTMPAHPRTRAQLSQTDPHLADFVLHHLPPTAPQGFFPIPITGYRIPLPTLLRKGIQSALAPLQHQPAIRTLLNHPLFEQNQTESRTFSQWFRQLQTTLAQLGYAGTILILDELGKALEYAADHPDLSDIYLLQEIAEFANRSAGTPLILIGILHQPFERYVSHLSPTTQREWSKIQGRFADLPFQEPPHQQLWLVANALQTTLPPTAHPILDQQIQTTLLSNWLPPTIASETFPTLCHQAYPLHPTTLITLPYLFRRLAQNERSLFTYLTSHEPLGLQEFLENHILPNTIRLADLFDYLMANFQGRLYASLRARLLTETQERLENSPNLSPQACHLLKTIGILNWLAEVSPIQATKETLFAAIYDPQTPDNQIWDTLETLQKQSLIVYRQYNRSYAIWQGSDINIEERLLHAQKQLSPQFSLAQNIQEQFPPYPIIARRHSYQTGFSRYFECRYLDLHTLSTPLPPLAQQFAGRVILCLSTNPDDATLFQQWAQKDPQKTQPDLLIGILQPAPSLTELLHQHRCLLWVSDNTPNLQDDSVARRELRTRRTEIEMLIKNELSQLLNLNQIARNPYNQWFHQDKPLRLTYQRSLSALLSDLSDQLFAQGPILRNELINRNAISGQAAAARRNLLEAILTRPNAPLLGIQGYPPERSLYQSLLLATHLHQPKEADEWQFVPPPAHHPLRLHPTWQQIDAFIFADPPQPRPLPDLYRQLKQAPYKLTDGILPIFLCVFLTVYKNETTLYREGSLLPDPSVPDWEVLLRRPELFAVAGCRITGNQMLVVQRLAAGLKTEPYAMPVVRELIRRLHSLPEYSWRTQRLSPQTLAVRRAIEIAHSPEKLLFDDLPRALSIHPFAGKPVPAPTLENFFAQLNLALQELANTLPKRLHQARDELLTACGFPVGEAGWQLFTEQAAMLLIQTTHPDLMPLLRRISDTPDPQAALHSAITYIVNKPLRSWSDADSDRYVQRAGYFGNLVQSEQKRQRSYLPLFGEMQARSQQIIDELRQHLKKQYENDNSITQTVLQHLLDELETLNSTPYLFGEMQPHNHQQIIDELHQLLKKQNDK